MKKKSTGKKRTALLPKEILFCHEYVANLGNGKQAAISAGYSAKTAESQASRMLRRAKVQEKIQALMGKLAKKATKTAEDIRRELERIGFSNIKDVVSWNESGAAFLHNSEEIPDDVSAAIETIQVTEDAISTPQNKEQTRFVQKTKVRMHNKLRALELLGKELGMFKDVIKHEGGIIITQDDITPEERAVLKTLTRELAHGKNGNGGK